MGTDTVLSIAGYPLLWAKSAVDPVIMTIFRESDKQVLVDKMSESEDTSSASDIDGDMPYSKTYVYTNTITNIRQRLNVMGFSLRRVREKFDAGIREITESLYDDDDDANLLKRADFNDWIEAFRSIWQRQLMPQWGGTELLDEVDPLIRYILGPIDLEPNSYHFPCDDIRYLIRMFVEVAPDNAFVTQDITALVYAGYYSPDDTVCDDTLRQLTADYPINERIIILTEGSSDSQILAKSLKLLYPHLADCYSFMVFDQSNVSGGAPSLVATVKAFAAAGISNRVIALFDNDTAARVARKGLEKTSIPTNIKVVELPPLEIAKRYPTLGPSGIALLDVNGLACSLEMYFGNDILTRNGSLVPVQWRGYEASLKQYQGEITAKHEIQEAFLEKIERCYKDRHFIGSADWEPMMLLWETIFNVFA